jgi:protocatechuate 3,4-dioxygenase beta subunit
MRIQSRRAALIGVAGALLVGALVYVFAFRSTSSAGAPTPGSAASNPALRPVAHARPPSPDLVRDNDRRGTLRLEGQVVDEAGAPVAGAQVTIDSRPARTVTSEDDGSFVLDGLLGRTYELVATHGEFAAGPVATRVTEATGPIVLRLVRGATVDVSVTAAGAPVAGAQVELDGSADRRAETDAAGVARFRGLPSGGYRVGASSPGHARASTWLRVGSGPHSVKLALSRGAELSGRVVDAAGAPVAGANVSFAGVSDWGQQNGDASATGADGTFRVVAPAGSFRFSAHHAAHAPGTSEVVTHDGVTPRGGIEIRLEAGAALAGVVVDRAGAAVPWARVRAAVAVAGFSWGRTRETTADGDGVFRLEALPRAAIDVVAANELATSETARVDLAQGDRGDVRLALDLDGAIAGIVVDGAGRPVEGAQVHADHDDAVDRKDGHLRDTELALTDSGGAFAFHGLRPGAYELRATRSQGQLESLLLAKEVKANAGDTAVKIVLHTGGSIAGTVRFADGRTPPMFTVSLGVWGSAIPVAHPDGKFDVRDLPPRTYEVTIRGPGFTERILSSVAITADKAVDLGTIVVERGRSISGRVVDASGNPVANATVVAGPILWGTGSKPTTPASFGGPPGAGLIKEATTDATGAFTIAGVGRGTRHVVADHETHGRSTPITLPSTTDSTANLELRLAKFGALEGTVTSGGKPAANIIVTAQSKTVAEAMFTVLAGSDGTYRFDRLATDRYLVSAMVGMDPTRGINFHGRTAAVTAGATVKLDLAIGAGDLTLVVTPVAGDKPVKLALVESYDGTVEARTHADLDRLGTTRDTNRSTFGMSFGGKPARITGLPPGVTTVCVCPYPDEVDPVASEDYMVREGDKLPVFCKQLTLAAAPAEQQLQITVEIPKFVPPPKD